MQDPLLSFPPVFMQIWQLPDATTGRDWESPALGGTSLATQRAAESAGHARLSDAFERTRRLLQQAPVSNPLYRPPPPSRDIPTTW